MNTYAASATVSDRRGGQPIAVLQPYLPVAVVTRLADGQLVVLCGQASLIETGMDMDARADGSYRTTIEWRPGTSVMCTNLPDYIPGVTLHDDDGIGGPLFHPEPTYDTGARQEGEEDK